MSGSPGLLSSPGVGNYPVDQGYQDLATTLHPGRGRSHALLYPAILRSGGPGVPASPAVQGGWEDSEGVTAGSEQLHT